MRVALLVSKTSNNHRCVYLQNKFSFRDSKGNHDNKVQNDYFTKNKSPSFGNSKIVNTRMFVSQMNDTIKHSPHISIDFDRLNEVANFLKNKSPKLPDWSIFIGNQKHGINRAMFEIAIFISQQGGCITKGINGKAVKWQIEGKSGSNATVYMVKQLKNQKLLPGLDTVDPNISIDSLLDDDIPYKAKRLEIFREFAQPDAYNKFCRVIDDAKVNDNEYHFEFKNVQKLSETFPEAFGGDKMYKKAIVLINAMAGLARPRGIIVKLDTPVGADYRLPQALEGLGVLRFSTNVNRKIKGRLYFNEDDSAVTHIRAATIVVSDMLSKATGLDSAQIDNWLWNAGRAKQIKDDSIDLNYKPLPHIMVPTMLF